MEAKVSLVIYCKCGSKIMIEKAVKKSDKFYCPKCDSELKNIVNK